MSAELSLTSTLLHLRLQTEQITLMLAKLPERLLWKKGRLSENKITKEAQILYDINKADVKKADLTQNQRNLSNS